MERLAVPALLLLLAMACDSPGGGGGITDEDYFPYSTGNSWQYDRFGEIDTLGIQYSASGGTSVSVTAVTDMGGFDLVQTASVGYDTLYGDGVDSLFLPLAGLGFVRMDGIGIWQYTDSTMTDSLQVVAFPITVGDTWEYYQGGSSPGTSQGEVVAMDESVTVPDGTFDSVLHLRYTIETGVTTTIDRWFAPGTGLVLTETQVTAGGGPAVLYDMTEELVDHLIVPGV